MSLDSSVIDAAMQKKYSDFSCAVLAELHAKLANRPELVKYVNEFDKIKNMKTAFANISKMGKESL